MLSLTPSTLARDANPILAPPKPTKGRGVAAAEAEMAARPHAAGDKRVALRHRSDLRDARQAKSAAEALGDLPGDGEASHVIISGRFSLWDVVPAVVERVGTLESLHVCTLGFSRRKVEAFCRMVDAGTVGRVRLLCSHYFKGTSPDLYRFAVDECSRRPGRAELLSVRTHCKILLMRHAGGTLVAESSANLRSCKNIEQLTLFGSPAVYEFHRGWVDALFAEGDHFVNRFDGPDPAPLRRRGGRPNL